VNKTLSFGMDSFEGPLFEHNQFLKVVSPQVPFSGFPLGIPGRFAAQVFFTMFSGLCSPLFSLLSSVVVPSLPNRRPTNDSSRFPRVSLLLLPFGRDSSTRLHPSSLCAGPLGLQASYSGPLHEEERRGRHDCAPRLKSQSCDLQLP